MTIPIRRRDFNTALLLGAPSLFAKPSSIDAALSEGVKQHKIPCAVAMAATAKEVTFAGAVSTTSDAIFNIASMTKAITTAAALQMVERGKLTLDEPAAKHLPDLAKLQVLHGYDSSGKPDLKPVSKPVTLRHLLTHTSGFCYPYWDKQMFDYTAKAGMPPKGSDPLFTPLMFEPGARWQYGPSIDWAGRLVEAVSGLNLEDYFQKHILGPLGMKDTSYILKSEQFPRLVTTYNRQPDGTLNASPKAMPKPPQAFNGGGGLYSTAADYIQFMQMILNKGVGPQNRRILEAKTVALMCANQTGDLPAGKMPSFNQSFSRDVDLHPGEADRYTFGFLLNPKAYRAGRSANSLAWAGLFNTYYWIDPARNKCGVVLMQLLPFADTEALGVLGEFERAVYAAG